jgi:tryptophan synthase beta subunit
MRCHSVACGTASNAIGYAKVYRRSHDAVIRVHDEAGNAIETHEHKGDFKEC